METAPTRDKSEYRNTGITLDGLVNVLPGQSGSGEGLATHSV